MTRETERIELQVLLANLLRAYHHLQITDQALAGAAGVDAGSEETRKILGRVGVAAGMLEKSSGDLLVQVTGVDPVHPGRPSA